MTAHRYVVSLLGGALIALAAIIAMGLSVDAFGVFGTRLMPARSLPPALRASRNGDRVTKALEISRRSGDAVVFLGDSRTQHGFDPASPLLEGRSGYNAANPAASLREQIITLDFLLAHEGAKVRQIVWGLNLESYTLPLAATAGTDFKDSAFAGQSLLSGYLRHLLAYEYVTMSWKALKRWRGEVRAAMTVRGSVFFASPDAMTQGATARFLAEMRGSVRTFGPITWSYFPAMTAEFEARLAALKARGLEVDLAVTPVHVWRLAVYRMTGLGPELDDWKRLLAAMTQRLAEAPGSGRVRLFDFSLPAPETEQAVLHPAPGERLNFIESSHFYPWLGDRMLQRMKSAGADDPAEGEAEFGRELTPANVDAVIAQSHRDLDAWAGTHPQDMAVLADIVARAGMARP